MSNKYEYLKLYTNDTNSGNWFGTISGNWFGTVSKEKLEKAEIRLGQQFPSQLRDFYLEIGYGFLTTPYNVPKDYQVLPSENAILHPLDAANFYQGIIEHQIEPKEEALESDERYISLETLNYLLKPGDLPFYEVDNSDHFLIMKLTSDNPNAVWDNGGDVKIEDSFERFIWRLYYEDPNFYEEIIQDYYKDK